MPDFAQLAPAATLTYAAVAVALIGALLGTAGFAFAIVRRQTKRTADLLDLLDVDHGRAPFREAERIADHACGPASASWPTG